jgi:uncharacterized protein (UPF0276 family)
MLTRPSLGFGLGLRVDHYEAILADRPRVDWFEVLSENYLVPGGKPELPDALASAPPAMHGVSLDRQHRAAGPEYLRQLKALATRVEPVGVRSPVLDRGGGPQHPRSSAAALHREALAHVIERVRTVQDILGRRILLENVSSYVAFRDSRLTEWEFLREVALGADCLLLLDVNNIYVSSVNHEFDAHAYLAAVPAERVQQIHLAGHENHGDYLVDTHDHPVPDPVWQM